MCLVEKYPQKRQKYIVFHFHLEVALPSIDICTGGISLAALSPSMKTYFPSSSLKIYKAPHHKATH